MKESNEWYFVLFSFPQLTAYFQILYHRTKPFFIAIELLHIVVKTSHPNVSARSHRYLFSIQLANSTIILNSYFTHSPPYRIFFVTPFFSRPLDIYIRISNTVSPLSLTYPLSFLKIPVKTLRKKRKLN